MLFTVTSSATAVKWGPFCILVDTRGQGSELGGNLAYMGYLTNLGLTRCNEV